MSSSFYIQKSKENQNPGFSILSSFFTHLGSTPELMHLARVLLYTIESNGKPLYSEKNSDQVRFTAVFDNLTEYNTV